MEQREGGPWGWAKAVTKMRDGLAEKAGDWRQRLPFVRMAKTARLVKAFGEKLPLLTAGFYLSRMAVGRWRDVAHAEEECGELLEKVELLMPVYDRVKGEATEVLDPLLERLRKSLVEAREFVEAFLHKKNKAARLASGIGFDDVHERFVRIEANMQDLSLAYMNASYLMDSQARDEGANANIKNDSLKSLWRQRFRYTCSCPTRTFVEALSEYFHDSIGDLLSSPQARSSLLSALDVDGDGVIEAADLNIVFPVNAGIRETVRDLLRSS